MTTNCCDEVPVVPPLSVKLVDGNLYINYNGKNLVVPLDTLTPESNLSFKNIFIPVVADEESTFFNVIPVGETVEELSIAGIRFFEGDTKDYTINGRNIVWHGSVDLEEGETIVIKTMKL